MLKLLIFFLWIPGFLFAQVPQKFTSVIRAAPVIDAGPDLIKLPGQSSVQPVVTSDDPGPGQSYLYFWAGPDGYTSVTMEPFLSAIGNYSLQATNIFGCSASDSLVLRAMNPTDTSWTMDPLPSVCIGDTIALDKYISYTGYGVFSDIIVENRMFIAKEAGTFELSWRLGLDTVYTHVTVNNNPDVSVLDYFFGCDQDSVWVSANGNANINTFAWYLASNPMDTISRDQYFRVKVSEIPTQYVLSASNGFCSVRDTTTAQAINAEFKIEQDTLQGSANLIYTSFVRVIPLYQAGISYDWNFGDYNGAVPTSTEVNASWNYKHYGQFTITLTMSSMCGISTAQQKVLVTQFVTSSEDMEASNISVYPNPVINSITVDGLTENVSELQIIDSRGRVILTQNLENQTSEKIDVSSYISGVYIVKIVEKSGDCKVIKIVKQ